MNMLLDKDGKTNELIVRSLLERECQFIIIYENTTKVRIAFHEGTWKIMRDNGDFFTFYDSFGINECNNKLLEGLVRVKTEIAEKRKWGGLDSTWRIKPSWVMAEVLKLWIGSFDNIVSIDVTQFGRDGWFVNFDDK